MVSYKGKSCKEKKLENFSFSNQKDIESPQLKTEEQFHIPSFKQRSINNIPTCPIERRNVLKSFYLFCQRNIQCMDASLSQYLQSILIANEEFPRVETMPGHCMFNEVWPSSFNKNPTNSNFASTRIFPNSNNAVNSDSLDDRDSQDSQVNFDTSPLSMVDECDDDETKTKTSFETDSSTSIDGETKSSLSKKTHEQSSERNPKRFKVVLVANDYPDTLLSEWIPLS